MHGTMQSASQMTCTGDWWGGLATGKVNSFLATPCSPAQSIGIFTNRWTGKVIEVAGAGSARFWIEFEFGNWLFPKMTDNFNLLRPVLVAAIEECFGVKVVQAGIGVG